MKTIAKPAKKNCKSKSTSPKVTKECLIRRQMQDENDEMDRDMMVFYETEDNIHAWLDYCEEVQRTFGTAFGPDTTPQWM